MASERLGFGRHRYLPEPPAPLRPLARKVSYGPSAGHVAKPKEAVKAKPGKGAPTAEERAWMGAIVEFGCICCYLDGHGYAMPQVHHILRGGRRIGHLFTLPLCPGHHQDGAGASGMVARHPYKARFEAKYGDEMLLLAALRQEIGVTA